MGVRIDHPSLVEGLLRRGPGRTLITVLEQNKLLGASSGTNRHFIVLQGRLLECRIRLLLEDIETCGKRGSSVQIGGTP